jgi:uncharacterized protein YoxC
MTELTELFKAFATRPELALVALLIVVVAYGVQKLFNAGFKLLGNHLENIDENFKSVASDLSGLRTDVTKIAQKLESHAEIVQDKIDDLDRRVTRLEDRDK